MVASPVGRWRPARGPWLFGAVALMALSPGCSNAPLPRPPPTVDHDPVAPALPSPGSVATEPLTENRITIGLQDLPPPFSTESARKSPIVVPPPTDARLAVPPGFTVQVFAEGLDKPRWLALTPQGDVLVTETRENRIVRLTDVDHDGQSDTATTFADEADGLDIPFGMAFADNAFFLGNHDEVRRFDYKEGELVGPGRQLIALPGGGYNQHWTRNVIPAGDGEHLYVSIGSATNVDPEPLPRASIQRIRLDGSKMETYGHGLRNPVGLAVHPTTGELYCTVNERDAIGDDLVPDFFTSVKPGGFYGWPYAYLAAENLDPRLTRRRADGVRESLDPGLVHETITPDVLFQAHSAPLGVAFYTGTTFPERYRTGAFVAFRGSWNRDQGTGYKLVYVPFRNQRPVGHYEDFLTGFLIDPSGPTTWGRPVGMLVMPDGALLFTEEMNGRIYRVQFQG